MNTKLANAEGWVVIRRDEDGTSQIVTYPMDREDADESASLRSDNLTIVRARVAELEAAVEKAANRFERYANIHAKKRTIEGDAKSAENRVMAESMRRALDAAQMVGTANPAAKAEKEKVTA